MPVEPSSLKTTALVATLRGCALFAGLAGDDLLAVARITRPKALAKGEYLFHEGGAAPGFYVVQRGAVNVHRVNAAGKEQVIRIFRAGESFAEAALVAPRGFPADALAVEASQVLVIEKGGFLELLGRRPDLALRMLAAMSAHLRELVDQLEDLNLKDVETRVAHWLLRRCPPGAADGPVHIDLTSTKRVLAAELSTVAETLSRSLAKFREHELITVESRRITVRSPARLRSLLRRNLGEAEVKPVAPGSRPAR